MSKNNSNTMSEDLQKSIKDDWQIKKFSMYGFLKNLRFFEPYLLIYLLSNGLSLLEIGLLFSIREAFMYVFEIPSGIIADYYGRKKELYMCFSFYIVSFVFFFFSSSFWLAALAMVFYGLGEAFRSGTHKAMIYSYLEEKEWSKHKAFVYGRTRSFSLIGSAISSLLAILLILNLPGSKFIFLVSIIPYILDLLLIMSYPNSLDGGGKKKENVNFFLLMKNHLADIMKGPVLRRILLQSASFEAVFKSIKDYIQPILEILIASSGFLLIGSMTADENLKIILGISYGIIYTFGAMASKRVYKLKRFASSARLMNVFYLVLGLNFFLLFLAIRFSQPLLIVIMFIITYVIKDMRKPIFVDVCDDHMEKHQRATVLSVESQLKALMTIFLAPLVGFIADQFGVSMTMLLLAGLLLLSFPFLKVRER